MTDDERDELDEDLDRIADELENWAARRTAATGRAWIDDLHALADALEQGDELPDDEDEPSEPAAFRFAVHDADCESLGTITLPWPNVEHGDELTLDDGSRWIVRRVVTLGSPHTLDGMLQLEPESDSSLGD